MLNPNLGPTQRSDGRIMPIPIGYNDVGEPVVILVGKATSDSTIVTEVGADANYGDGSLYIGGISGGSTLWQKRNDIWVSI